MPGPGPGDAGARGDVSILTGEPTSQLCALVSVTGASAAPTAAHLHKGGSTEVGPTVLTLKTPDPANGGPVACYRGLDQTVVDDVRANPGGYYIDVHTADHPNGAVRGQLFSVV